MEWNKGFSSTYYAAIVDRVTWRDMEKFEISGGNINRSESSLVESASVDTRFEFDNEKWIRIYMDARQNGTTEHVALFTGLAVPPSTRINGNIKSYSLECYSVLKPCEDILLQRGFYVPQGINGGTMIKTLLETTPAPVEISANAPTLNATIIAESGETNLSMIGRILKAINWRIRLTGDGTIHVCPKASEASVAFSALDNDAIEPQLTLNHDWFECPNVFRAISGDLMAVARDDRESSFLSTINRGREVWKEEASCHLADNEGIAEYARRRLLEEQSKAYDASYNRRFHPDLTISDYVELRYPKQGLDGGYKINSQRITLGHNGRTEEKIEYR